MLPEFPWSLILHFRNIVMGYPIWIVVKTVVGKIFFLEFIVRIKNRFHMILVFDNIKPCEYFSLEILNRECIRLVFHVQDRWKVTFFKTNLL
jgi:hypothetical protein